MLEHEIQKFMTVTEYAKFKAFVRKRPTPMLKGSDSEYKDYYLGDIQEFLNVERAAMKPEEVKELEEQPQEVPMWARSKRPFGYTKKKGA